MKGARNLKDMERELMKDNILSDRAADDYKSEVAREIEAQAHDIGNSGFDKIKYIRGNAVDKEGHVGWADYATGNIIIPMFEKVADKYKWARDIFHKVVYKHEIWEQFYKGRKDHMEMEMENVKHTDDYELHLAEAATLDLGMEQGNKEAGEVAYKTGIAKLLQKYNIDEKYLEIKEGIANVLGMGGYRQLVPAGAD